MLARYSQAMDVLHRLCLWISGLGLVVISIVIPYGVFARYVLNAAKSWPEPLAIITMIVVTFLSAAACYRDNLHIGVMVLPNALHGAARTALGWVVELCMAGANLFMLVWGLQLVETTFHQVIAEFPLLSVGITYLPIPVGGAITLLFVLERMMKGSFFASPSGESVTAATTD
jgi:TRAP-type C4-dicarboxylate transport system permease small subunit